MINSIYSFISNFYDLDHSSKKTDSAKSKTEEFVKNNSVKESDPSYFDNVGKVWKIAKVTVSSDVYQEIAALVAVNCMLPAATAATIYYVNTWGQDSEEENDFAYKSALTVLIALLSEQLRVNYNRFKGKDFRNHITQYLYSHVYGTNASNAAIKMNLFIPELGSGVSKNMAIYSERGSERSIGYTVGSAGNICEIVGTGATLYYTSSNLWTPSLSFLSCATAAMIIRTLSLLNNETRKKEKNNEKKQDSISPIVEKTKNISVLRAGSQTLQKLVNEKRELDLKDAFEHCRTVSARDIVLEMAKHIVKISNAYILGSGNREMINNCSLQGATMLGSFRRLAGFIFEDKKNFSDGLDGLLHLIQGIEKFEEFIGFREKNFKMAYSQNLDENVALSLRNCNFAAFDKENQLKHFLDSYPNGKFIEKYQAALQQENLLRIQNGSLDLEKGKIYKLSGASNAGKSSFIQALEGYWPMMSSNLFASCKQKEVSVICGGALDVLEECTFIDLLLFPRSFSNKGNDRGIDLEKEEGKQIADRLLYLLEKFNLADKLPKGKDGSPVIKHGNKGFWSELSSGEANRAVIIRTLMSEMLPKILILDEVTANVDSELERTIFTTLREELGADATIVFVKHQDDINSQADSVLYNEVIHFDLEEKQLKILSRESYLELISSTEGRKAWVTSKNILGLETENAPSPPYQENSQN